MRKNSQVAIYCAFKEKNSFFYVLLKRNKERGGFWQAITGGEEDFDKENLTKTAIRELKEELGINISKEQIIKIPYSFKFKCKEGVERTENCFGVILSLEQKNSIRLSEEHNAIIYSTDTEHLISLLKFKENKIALESFIKLINSTYREN
jgi:8-oxo-dGTP pyrophosphatase MutT (NUDIX family)